MPLFFTQLAQDNFQRADENPLNPAVWTPASNVGGPGSNLQIIGDACTGTGSGSYLGSEFYTGVAFPQNQYIKLTVGALDVPSSNVGIFAIFLRASLPNGLNSWAFAGENGSNATQTIFSINNSSGGSGAVVGSLVSPGDVFLFAVAGSQGFAYRNGVLLQSLTGTTTAPGGKLGIAAVATSSVSATNFTNFSAGVVSLGPTEQTVIEGQFVNTANNPNPVMGAFPQNHRQQLDLIQIQSRGGQVVWNLTYNGTVNVNPPTWTSGTLLGQFAGVSFQDAFIDYNANVYQQDIIQIEDRGGNVVWFMDWTGTVNFPTSSLPTS